jgi:hypothetical protein
VCLNGSQQLRVSATETAIPAAEFGYVAQTASATLTATVRNCSGPGMPPPPGQFCIKNPSLEGNLGLTIEGSVPPDWTLCAPSPDVQPDTGSGLIPASDGATYAGFGTLSGVQESLGGAFCAPLEAGERFRLLWTFRWIASSEPIPGCSSSGAGPQVAPWMS